MEHLQSILKFGVFIGLMTVFLGCAAAPRGPSAGMGVDDDITTQIERAIFQSVDLRTSIIHVSTDQGVVSLAGMVEKAPYVYTAKQIASNVPGVVEVQDFLVVKDPGRTGGR